jgi:hypothetical protein
MLGLREDAPQRHGAAQPTPAPGGKVAAEPAIRCAACGRPVTTRHQRIAVQGACEHRFMNPGGLLFHIGCFADALGCRIQGPASDEYPWFPGMSWRLALCGGCGTHLGWHFRGEPAGAGFFGLILDRLREGEGDGKSA